jgi:hypothetical protein
MMAYIVFCGSRSYPIRPDIIGDNIYYLGFLFTLVSLAYTLYKFTSADNEIDQIIKNFGIALSTTLIGVVGRVYFNQTHDQALDDQNDPEQATHSATYLIEEEKLLHADLKEKTGHLLDEIDALQASLVALKTSTIRSIEETTQASMNGLLSNMNALYTEFKTRLEQDRLNQVAMQDAVTTSIQSSALAFNELSTEVQRSAQLISQEVEQSLQHYGRLSGEIKQEAKSSMEVIDALKSGLSRLGNLGSSDSVGLK